MCTKARNLKGALADCANPDLISKEKEAWADAISEKYSFSKLTEVEPDKWDLEMIKRAEEDNDGDVTAIEDFAKSLGIDYKSL